MEGRGGKDHGESGDAGVKRRSWGFRTSTPARRERCGNIPWFHRQPSNQEYVARMTGFIRDFKIRNKNEGCQEKMRKYGIKKHKEV